MWSVIQIPVNYTASSALDDEKWCIIDEDGDIHDFYSSKEEAEEALKQLLAVH